MCDYSLEGYKSRAAVDGEELVVKQFRSGTMGFVEPRANRRKTDLGAAFREDPTSDCAVCCKPGVEMTLHLRGEFQTRDLAKKELWGAKIEKFDGEIPVTFHTLVGASQFSHRDGFMLSNGRFMLVQELKPGTRAIVTKALPKEITEAAKGEKAFKPEIELEQIEAPSPADGLRRVPVD
jgi:hypothetical protein